MKKVNTIGLLLLCWIFALPAMAQNSERRKPADGTHVYQNEAYYNPFALENKDRQYWGVRWGYNSTRLGLDGCTGMKGHGLHAMNFGVVYGIRVSNYAPIYLEPGLLYTNKGSQISDGTNNYVIRMHMLELPIVFKYKIETGADNLSVQPFLGGFFSVGLGGNYRDFTNFEKHEAFDKGAFRRGDAGFRIGCGIQYQVFYGELSYDIGMANMARKDASSLQRDLNYDDFDDKIHTMTFSATLGLVF